MPNPPVHDSVKGFNRASLTSVVREGLCVALDVHVSLGELISQREFDTDITFDIDMLHSFVTCALRLKCGQGGQGKCRAFVKGVFDEAGRGDIYESDYTSRQGLEEA